MKKILSLVLAVALVLTLSCAAFAEGYSGDLKVWVADAAVDFTNEIGYLRSKAKHQTSRQTIHFKTAARQQKQKEEARGYRHKCAVCGRTDTDFPDLEFRYCSRCEGYHCFCQDHIFNHEHFT